MTQQTTSPRRLRASALDHLERGNASARQEQVFHAEAHYILALQSLGQAASLTDPDDLAGHDLNRQLTATTQQAFDLFSSEWELGLTTIERAGLSESQVKPQLKLSMELGDRQNATARAEVLEQHNIAA